MHVHTQLCIKPPKIWLCKKTERKICVRNFQDDLYAHHREICPFMGYLSISYSNINKEFPFLNKISFQLDESSSLHNKLGDSSSIKVMIEFK